jgi:hypothetical protein
MGSISRRDFAVLCGGALAMGGLTASWPGPLLASGLDDTDDKLTGLSLAEASALIHNRTVSSTQLTQAALARIAAYNPKINAYITVMATQALKQAAQLDDETKAGKFRSPLHGIPIALKDNIDTAGVRTTAASPMFRTRVPTEDADVVRRLDAAGAVILGKLNLQHYWRLVLGFGRSCCRRPVLRGARHRYGWKHSRAFLLVRHCGHQADHWSRFNSRNYSVPRVARSLRPHGAHRRRCSDDAHPDGRLR